MIFSSHTWMLTQSCSHRPRRQAHRHLQPRRQRVPGQPGPQDRDPQDGRRAAGHPERHPAAADRVLARGHGGLERGLPEESGQVGDGGVDQQHHLHGAAEGRGRGPRRRVRLNTIRGPKVGGRPTRMILVDRTGNKALGYIVGERVQADRRADVEERKKI
jgi:hypothetical protein